MRFLAILALSAVAHPQGSLSSESSDVGETTTEVKTITETAKVIHPYLPVGMDCGTAINPNRLTELIQFFIERDARSALHAPFFRTTKNYCRDVCIQSLVEFAVDKTDLFSSVVEVDADGQIFKQLRNNFCVDMAKFSHHGRILVDINKELAAVKQCEPLKRIKDYCAKQECDGFHRQCDMVLRREWCRLANQNRERVPGRSLDCFVYDFMRKIPPYKLLVDHNAFDTRIKTAVEAVHKTHVEMLQKECAAAQLSSECTFDEVFEQNILEHLRIRAAQHDAAQCAKIHAASPKWMKTMSCACSVEAPCTKAILAREARIEYHRVRFIDLVMVLQRAPVKGEAEFVCNNGGITWLSNRLSFTVPTQCFPELFDATGSWCAFQPTYHQPHCWSALASEMIRLLDVDNGGFFRTQVEILFATFFGGEQKIPPMDRALDTSDYEIYSNLQDTYFQTYRWCEGNKILCEKDLLLGHMAWRLEDLVLFVEKLLQGHADAVPLIIHDDVAQNTLYTMYALLRRIAKMHAPVATEQSDVPHDDIADYELADGVDEMPTSFLQTRNNVDEEGEILTDEGDDEGAEEVLKKEKVEKQDEKPTGQKAAEPEEKTSRRKRRVEKDHMPPQLSWRASPREYVEGLIQLKLSRCIRKMVDGLLARQRLTHKGVESILPEHGISFDRRRMGVRFQFHAFLSDPSRWDGAMLEEACDPGVEYRRKEKEYVVEQCKNYSIDVTTAYIPTDHHDRLEGMKHLDFLNGGMFSECSLQHVLARHYAVQSVDAYQNHHPGDYPQYLEMELDHATNDPSVFQE